MTASDAQRLILRREIRRTETLIDRFAEIECKAKTELVALLIANRDDPQSVSVKTLYLADRADIACRRACDLLEHLLQLRVALYGRQ